MSGDGDEGDNGNPDEAPDGALTAQPTEKQLRARRATKKVLGRLTVAFWRKTLSDPVGRREMWKLLETCHFREEPFMCGPNGFPQPEATWFKAGEKALGLRLYQMWLALAPDLVILMQSEHDISFQANVEAREDR